MSVLSTFNETKVILPPDLRLKRPVGDSLIMHNCYNRLILAEGNKFHCLYHLMEFLKA